MNLQDVTIENVLKVYSGKKGKCMCGCAGSYAYRAATRCEGGEDRGYPVGADEISDRQVVRVLRLVQAHEASVEYGDEGEYVALDLGTKTYTVYLRSDARIAI